MDAPFHQLIRATPFAPAQGRHWDELASLQSNAEAEGAALEGLAKVLEKEPVRRLLASIFAGSPYVRMLILRDLNRLQDLLCEPPAASMARLQKQAETELDAAPGMTAAMRGVRVFKSASALLIALCDLGGVWPVMTVTDALTKTADTALQACVRFLFKQALERGDWTGTDRVKPDASSGYIVLGMGKYGAFELNYSSDIDLIIFFEATRARVRENLDMQTFFVRLTRDLVRLMDERSPDGYVFRTDLRLRPDAGATQIALSTDAAMIYYESVGQNWERAALIKARPVAGDIEAGEALLAELAPFIWRRYLDFAAIADVHAMKRQIHAHRGFGAISVPGHNVKLGPGGIREIEFFAQTQQLIAGGRQRDLRVRATLPALKALTARGWIRDDVRASLDSAYCYLRTTEHRIQMVADEQTHELPDDQAQLETFAHFAGYETRAAFEQEFTSVLETVQRHYQALFEDSPQLSPADANMVFAGETDDPDTVAALTQMGFSQPSSVLASVRGWHHGRYPAVRSPRARERLTEVQPMLIAALGATADPDLAFSGFDRFVASLPEGVQLFSLLRANPNLLRLVADIMGTAPRLARILSRRRRLLDAVLDPRTFGSLVERADLEAVIAAETPPGADMQDVLDRARAVGQEQAFLIGVRVLTGTIHAGQAGSAYALLAECLIARLQAAVEAEMERTHGRVPGGAAAVVAMGKLGGREMTASSDIDLILVYDFDDAALQSDGPRPLAPSQYYARLTQRLVAALSAPTAEGLLYDVDMRLRPSGQKGPVATQLSSFAAYQDQEAWTWEHLALTRARVVTGPLSIRDAVNQIIHQTLTRPRDRAKTAADVLDMRRRIEAEKGSEDIWDLKQVRGGLVDLEFIAQYLQLIHAPQHASVLDQNTLAVFQKLGADGVLDPADAETLKGACRLLHNLGQILRLCLEGAFDPAHAPLGLKQQLAVAGHMPDFTILEGHLRETLAAVHALFVKLVV
ncbi:MAG: bifunctional [glutamine synthetase] adenylyltransferase/[glutamine synthetase]-adenylyl-L-tyrosine phosphorylase [Hyphomicrobium sp.]